MPMTFPLYFTFYNESKSKEKEKEEEFLSEDEINVYIKYDKVSFSILNYEKLNIFFNKILSKKKLKQAFTDELSNLLYKPTTAISKNQVVKIFNKIYNKYYNTSYLLENE